MVSIALKNYKLSVFLSFSLFLVTYLLNGCGDECSNQDPTVILVNEGSAKADIQIKTSGGNTGNINNVEPGYISEKRSFAPGKIEFTVAIQGVTDNVVFNLSAQYCNEYTVKINDDNTVTGTGTKIGKLIFP